MPSYHETFGLVYIEALTQHLAIVYTKGQGVDGMLDSSVGEAVKASSKANIKRKDILAPEQLPRSRGGGL